MAVTANSYVTPQTPNRGVVRFVGTTDAVNTLKSLYVAGANGSKVFGAFAVNAGATAHPVSLAILNSTTTYVVNTVSLTVQAGNTIGVPPIALMSAANWPGLAVDNDGNPYLPLISGDTLQAEYATAQATTETIYVVCAAADY